MPCHFAPFGLSLAAALLACGCTIAGQVNDLHATDERVQTKEHVLIDEQARQADLQQQMQQLSGDLDSRKMTSEQLDARLADLQARNQKTASDNDAQRARKRRIDAQIASYRSQLATLRQNPLPDPQQQQAAIDDLKTKIKQRLTLLAQAN
jgi:septal ring factor EnvC (AmiA/AmiB activator)